MSQSLEKAEADRCARLLRDVFPSVPEQIRRVHGRVV